MAPTDMWVKFRPTLRLVCSKSAHFWAGDCKNWQKMTSSTWFACKDPKRSVYTFVAIRWERWVSIASLTLGAMYTISTCTPRKTTCLSSPKSVESTSTSKFTPSSDFQFSQIMFAFGEAELIIVINFLFAMPFSIHFSRFCGFIEVQMGSLSMVGDPSGLYVAVTSPVCP